MVLTPGEVLDRLHALVADRADDAALEHAYRFAVGMSEDEVAAMRAQPSWRGRVRSGTDDATRVPDCREPATGRCGGLSPPRANVLLLGGRSATGQKAVVAALHAALSVSDVGVLPGQAHAAQVTAPALIVNALRSHRSVGRPTDSHP